MPFTSFINSEGGMAIAPSAAAGLPDRSSVRRRILVRVQVIGGVRCSPPATVVNRRAPPGQQPSIKLFLDLLSGAHPRLAAKPAQARAKAPFAPLIEAARASGVHCRNIRRPFFATARKEQDLWMATASIRLTLCAR
jgi:hypothetical protein